MSRVLVICARRYNGHELWTALGVMQSRGHTFEVVSTDTKIMDEVTFQPNIILRTVDELDHEEMDNFDAIMIVSGNMADTEAYWDDERVIHQVAWANSSDKVVAAICCSVPTVRYAAKGKGVSFYPLVRSRQRLSEAGAILRTVAVTVDGKLVTAEHQMATQMWAEAFCEVLEGVPVTLQLEDSKFTPKGRPRKPIPELERLKPIDKREKLRNE